MFTVHSAAKIPFLFDAVLFWARQLRRISSGRHSRLKDEQKVASSPGERSQDDRVCWSSPAGHIQLSINIHKRMSWCHEARIYWSYRAIAALLIWGGTNTQRNREEMASPPKCEEDLMQLCQIESFTRRSTSPRRDDMLLVLCLNNNVKSSLPFERKYSQHTMALVTCCQTLPWISKHVSKQKRFDIVNFLGRQVALRLERP